MVRESKKKHVINWKTNKDWAEGYYLCYDFVWKLVESILEPLDGKGSTHKSP